MGANGSKNPGYAQAIIGCCNPPERSGRGPWTESSNIEKRIPFDNDPYPSQPPPRKAMVFFGGRPDSLVVPARRVSSGRVSKRQPSRDKAGVPRSMSDSSNHESKSKRPRSLKSRGSTSMRPVSRIRQIRDNPVPPIPYNALAGPSRATTAINSTADEFLLVRSIAESLNRAQSPGRKLMPGPSIDSFWLRPVQQSLQVGQQRGSVQASRTQDTQALATKSPPGVFLDKGTAGRTSRGARPVFRPSVQSDGPSIPSGITNGSSSSKSKHLSDAVSRRTSGSSNRRKLSLNYPLGKPDVENAVKELQDIVTARREEVGRASGEQLRRSSLRSYAQPHRPAIAPNMQVGVRSELLDDIGSALARHASDGIDLGSDPCGDNPISPVSPDTVEPALSSNGFVRRWTHRKGRSTSTSGTFFFDKTGARRATSTGRASLPGAFSGPQGKDSSPCLAPATKMSERPKSPAESSVSRRRASLREPQIEDKSQESTSATILSSSLKTSSDIADATIKPLPISPPPTPPGEQQEPRKHNTAPTISNPSSNPRLSLFPNSNRRQSMPKLDPPRRHLRDMSDSPLLRSPSSGGFQHFARQSLPPPTPPKTSFPGMQDATPRRVSRPPRRKPVPLKLDTTATTKLSGRPLPPPPTIAPHRPFSGLVSTLPTVPSEHSTTPDTASELDIFPRPPTAEDIDPPPPAQPRPPKHPQHQQRRPQTQLWIPPGSNPPPQPQRRSQPQPQPQPRESYRPGELSRSVLRAHERQLPDLPPGAADATPAQAATPDRRYKGDWNHPAVRPSRPRISSSISAPSTPAAGDVVGVGREGGRGKGDEGVRRWSRVGVAL